MVDELVRIAPRQGSGPSPGPRSCTLIWVFPSCSGFVSPSRPPKSESCFFPVPSLRDQSTKFHTQGSPWCRTALVRMGTTKGQEELIPV